MPGFTITPSAFSTEVTEGGGSDTVKIRLASVPTANVVVNLTKAAEPGDFTLAPIALTFTPANALTDQEVTVTAVDDVLQENFNEFGSVQLTATSGDPNYEGQTNAFSVIVFDNEP